MIVIFVHYERAPEIFRATRSEIVARAAKFLGNSDYAQSHPPGVPFNEFTLAWHALTKGLRDARIFDSKRTALAYCEAGGTALPISHLAAIISGINELSADSEDIVRV